MDATFQDEQTQDPDLPPLTRIGDIVAPAALTDVHEINKQELQTLMDMALKYAATVARFTTDGIAKQLHLSLPLTRDMLALLCQEGQIEELWQTGEGSAHYKIAQQGRDYAIRLTEVCGYVGPAPVRMESYAAMLRWQFMNTPLVKPEHVTGSLGTMVLSKKSMQLAGLAISSGRSLFVYGPSGNGKSSLGRCIHAALQGDYWIPYAISTGDNVIRVFDNQCHHRVEFSKEKAQQTDQRWIRVRRPLVIVGGELTLDMLDLIYSPSYRFYEAPPHLKANGGVFLVDDFGRERVTPEQLLNRFITPMEHSFDYFTLRTGQKIQLPLRHVLIIATNLSPNDVTDPAFLRRMGYRLYLGAPTVEQYGRIFNDYARKQGVEMESVQLERLLTRYKEQNREMRSCEPRDLIERAKDICKFHGRPLELSQKVMDLAWVGYFGDQIAPAAPSSKPELDQAQQLESTPGDDA